MLNAAPLYNYSFSFMYTLRCAMFTFFMIFDFTFFSAAHEVRHVYVTDKKNWSTLFPEVPERSSVRSYGAT